MYKVQLDILPEIALTYNPANANLSKLNAGFKGFYFSGGNKAENSGCWLDGLYKFFDATTGYIGYVGNALSDNDGHFAIEQSITVGGTNIDHILIRFDNVAGEYAKQVKVGATVYNNYGYTLVIPITPVASYTTYKIEFLEWSKKNSLVKVLTIKCGLTMLYDKFQLQGIDFTNEVLSGYNLASFGISLQTGSFRVLDRGILQAYSKVGKLQTGAKVSIYNEAVKEQEFVVQDYDADFVTSKWTISLVDSISTWDEEQFNGLDYAARTLKEIFDVLIPGAVYDDDLATDLALITIPTSYLQVSTVWQAINKACVLGLTRVYQINGAIHIGRVL